jgi:hypothetical protein
MSKISAIAANAFVACLAAASFAFAAGGGNKGSDAIWVNSPTDGAGFAAASASMRAGDRFTAGFTTSRTAYPWAHAQCFDTSGRVLWDQYRALQADGSIGVFELTSVSGDVAWPSAGADCKLELVNLQGKQSVLASSSFSVAS